VITQSVRLFVAAFTLIAAAESQAAVLFSTAPPARTSSAVLHNGAVRVNVEVADDFQVTQRSSLNEIVFWTLGDVPVTEFEYRIYSDNGGLPGIQLSGATVSNAVLDDLGGSGDSKQIKWAATVFPYILEPSSLYWFSLFMPSSATGFYGWQYAAGTQFGAVAVGGARPGPGFALNFPDDVAFELRGASVPAPPTIGLLLTGVIAFRAARIMRRRTRFGQWKGANA
jgi:hypothetical protein